jgi:acyl-CoA synthetase (AMP-forming)/AMP-acid ligase II
VGANPVSAQPPPAAPERSLATILSRAAADPRLSVATAVSCDGAERSFGQLHERSQRLAAGLAAAGVRRGDCVSVLLPNRIEWVELLFGIAAAGGVCVPVNVLLAPAEVAHVCEDSGSRWIVVDGRSLDLLSELPECVEQVIVVGEPATGLEPQPLRYEDLITERTPPAGEGPRPEDLAIIYYSSGTTGKPKGAAHTHTSVLWNAMGQIVDIGLTREDTYLLVPSLSWAAGFNNVFLSLLWLGGHSVVLPTHETAIGSIVANLESSRATHLMLVPTLVKQLLEAPELIARVRACELRWIMTGGEPIPKNLIESFEAQLPGCRLAQAYGMSEFPTIATILGSEHAASHAGSAGLPLCHTQIAVRDDEGQIVERGEGEILLRSLAVMREYFGNPDETARVFADGWFASGDRGRIDDEGFLWITGRVKDMIISGGLNVYPREIEEVIYRLDDVTEACVVGVPDERWGEVPAAVIVSEREQWEPATVIEHCRQSLASYKCPKHVFVRSERLPRNPSGKVLKREVAPWAAERVSSSSSQQQRR